MFDCVLNTPLALDVNDACFGDEPISPIRMRNKKNNVNNGTDVVNVIQGSQFENHCLAPRSTQPFILRSRSNEYWEFQGNLW